MNILIYTLFIFLFSTSLYASTSLSFNVGVENFGIWGSGKGEYTKFVGHKKPGAIQLACDFGENITAYRNFTDLDSGNYKISFYIKSENIQKHDYNSLWHFYDSGSGEQSLFRNMHGNFSWTKVEYTVYVKNEFKFWLRLKSPGKVWLDDFEIKKVSSKIKSFEMNLSPLKGFDLKRVFTKKRNNRRKKELTGTPFNLGKSKYKNFFLNDLKIKNFSGYYRLVLNVLNPTVKNYSFYLVVQDNKSVNYWSQLNFKTTLGPGLNKLNLDLNRALGERGSVKYNRKIDVNNIKKIFMIIDPDKNGSPTDNKFTVSKIYLDNLKIPIKPKDVMAFDFSSHKLSTFQGFTLVTSQDLYSKSKGYGFVDPKFYRIYDSKYASTINRSSINVLDSDFIVDLENGEYEIELNINSLGYWDVPFWKKRQVYLNNKLIYSKERQSYSDYLNDYFQFENVEPLSSDNLYDLYLSKIFVPIRTKLWVRDKKIHFKLKGDATGINLNSLLIWPTKISNITNMYLEELTDLKREENEIISRKIESKSLQKTQFIKIGFLEPSLDLTYTTKALEKTNLDFTGLSNESSFQIMQLINNDDISKIKFNFKGKNSDVLRKAISFHPLSYQFSSFDMNHETYKLQAKIVNPKVFEIDLEPNEIRYILLKIDFDIISTSQTGLLEIQAKNFISKIVLNLKKLKYTLPPVDIAAGFLGLDTIGTSYFENKNLLKFKQELRIKALQVLSKNGFTSFSGLPSVQVTKNNEKLDFDDQDLKEILNVSSKLKMSKSIFTYSGGFPKNILNFSKSKTDYTQVNNYISSLNKLYNQKIVYTFSDEAAGYSNKVEEDILKAQKLKTNIPKLLLGGFSGMYSNTKKLNSYFDYGFYSSLKKGDIVDIKNKGHFWGTYNGSVMPMNDPQFSFGVGLYFMEEIGLNHYLDWHLNATHNYPYFEFDGRETDSVMFYPRSNGDLYTSIKFEHAVLGLNIYRKLKLLDSLQSKMKPDLLNSYKTFKLVLRDGLDPYRFNDYYHKHTINSIDVSSKLSKFIGSID